MKATFISRDKNTVKFTMEFTADEFEQARSKFIRTQRTSSKSQDSVRARHLEASSKSTMAKASSLRTQSTHFSETPMAMHSLT